MSQINIMALRHSAFYAPLLMIMAGGFLSEEGLEYSYSIASPQQPLPDSLLNGQVHVAQSAVATSFAALERGEQPPVMHFAQINSRDGFFLAARDCSQSFSWSQLHGKDVLVDHLFQPMAMLKYALKKYDMSLDDFHVIDAGDVDEMDRQFRAGLGDFVHQQGPAPQQLEKDGAACVVASIGEVIGPVAFSSLCATPQWLETDMARAFVRAYAKALAYVVEAAAEDIAAQLQAAGFFPQIDKQVLQETIEVYKKLGCWQTSPVINRQSYETLLDVFIYDGLISQRYAYEQLISLPPGFSHG